MTRQEVPVSLAARGDAQIGGAEAAAPPFAMITILVTGFGPFPGVRHNPSAALVRALQRSQPRLSRLGIRLESAVLPVVLAQIETPLAELVTEVQPDAVLHFGVAARRNWISVECQARNHISLLRLDAMRSCRYRPQIDSGGPQILPARVPVRRLVAAFRQAGLAGRLSSDAGDYLCNAVFYRTLSLTRGRPCGFIHIPHPRRPAPRPIYGGEERRRPRFADIVTAAEIAVVVVAMEARFQRLHRLRGRPFFSNGEV